MSKLQKLYKIIALLIGLEGFVYHKQLNRQIFSRLFIPSKCHLLGYCIIGYGFPLLLVTTTLLTSLLTDTNHYIRIDMDIENGMEETVLCWLDPDYTLYMFVLPVGLVIMMNMAVMFVVVTSAYQHRAQHRY